jgi:proline dehydrogenase
MEVWRQLVKTLATPVVARAARSYVAGPELGDAVGVVGRLGKQGFASAICPWDASGTAPEQVAASYIAAQAQLAGLDQNCYLSIKAPSIAYRRDLLSLILAAGRANGRLHFDSLAPESVSATWSLIEETLPDFRNLTCTLPGRWMRSVSDAGWVIRHELGVRVVKGQWVDPEHPNADCSRGFLQVVDALAGRARHVAVATHDPNLARESLERLLVAETSCELELLFGLPLEGGLQVATHLKVPVRIYVPYGYAWLPYSLGQATRNPHIFFWMMHDMVTRRSSRIYS